MVKLWKPVRRCLKAPAVYFLDLLVKLSSLHVVYMQSFFHYCFPFLIFKNKPNPNGDMKAPGQLYSCRINVAFICKGNLQEQLQNQESLPSVAAACLSK